MVAYKRKKNTRQRGSTTHGWGAMKKHRGAGNRGGRGHAGTGKRGDSTKPSYWNSRYFGKLGFVKKGAKIKINTINLSLLDELLEKHTKKENIKKEGEKIVVDLSDFGFNKLLGGGVIRKKVKISVDYASDSAIEKVRESGGEVVLKKARKEPKQDDAGSKKDESEE